MTPEADPTEPARRRRADAAANAQRLVEAATELLAIEPGAGIEEIAAAAGVSRATVYRHFSSRAELVEAARVQMRAQADANERDTLRPAGELAGGPTPFDIADVLNKVPPHLLGEQIASEAQRLAGVTSVAVYLVDIDGTRLLRLAGSEEFPNEIITPFAVGPEIARASIPELQEIAARELPGSVMAPLLLRGRAIGVLLAIDAPEEPLLALARQAAASIELASHYTDHFDVARRRKRTSAAAEIQQNLLPPRIARVSGGVLAGNVLPGYEIGGDWFDYTENRDGAWLGVADSRGKGTIAAALGAVSLGAFRAQRRDGAGLLETIAGIHATIQELEQPGAFVNATIGRWRGPTSTFEWITCGDQAPLLLTAEYELETLGERTHDALGIGDAAREYDVSSRRLLPGERLILLSDGVLDRKRADGTTIGRRGVHEALAAVDVPAAAPLVRALQDVIHAASDDPLEDDATIVVFAPSTTA